MWLHHRKETKRTRQAGEAWARKIKKKSEPDTTDTESIEASLHDAESVAPGNLQSFLNHCLGAMTDDNSDLLGH